MSGESDDNNLLPVLNEEAIHCCVMMDYALDNHYVDPTIAINMEAGRFDVHPPSIRGETLSARSRKRKPSLLVNYCPWCGKRLAPLAEKEQT